MHLNTKICYMIHDDRRSEIIWVESSGNLAPYHPRPPKSCRTFIMSSANCSGVAYQINIDQPSLWDVKISDIVGYPGISLWKWARNHHATALHRGTILGYPAVFDIPRVRLRKDQMFGGLAHAAKHADVSHVPHVVCQDCAKPWMAGRADWCWSWWLHIQHMHTSKPNHMFVHAALLHYR